jgi:acetate kinase
VTPGGGSVTAERDRLEIICLNCGSSSVKAARYRVDDAGEHRLAERAVGDLTSVEAITRAAGELLDELAGDRAPDAVGHRIVHGGPRLAAPVLIDARVRAELDEVVGFAPLHLPSALAAIDAVTARSPHLAQVACFDTAFHLTLPETAWRLPIARTLTDHGIRRYGFHGLSYEYIVGAVGARELGRAVIAHLGNGASLCAVSGGQSVATSMGFTPTGGIPMGTRSGDLDPGVLVHLMRARGYGADELERLVDTQSGLLALGGTSDMHELLDRRRGGDEAATLAVEVFCARVAMEVGAYATLLGGLETLVFTAGIGERAADVRAVVGARLAHLGVRIDQDRNAANDDVISTDRSTVAVLVVPTDEDAMIARHSAAIVSG